MTEHSQLTMRADLTHVVVVRASRAHRAERGTLELLPGEIPVVVVDRAMIETLEALDPRVVIIDDDSPSFDTARVCRDLHESLPARLIVIGAGGAATEEATAIALLDAGADDYLPRTTSIDMLLARIRVALRAPPDPQQRPWRLIVGDITVDLDAHELFIAGEPAKCPPRQFLLLVALANHPNRVVTREVLLANVWNAVPGSVDTRRLRIAVSLLRGILGRGPRRPRIETVSHVGYRLVSETPDGGD